MTPALLVLISAAVVGLLGTGHLILTYFGPKLHPRDFAVRTAMQHDHPVITKQTTMWRAWIGFNVSHSLGAMLFGLVYGYLAAVHPAFLFQSVYLQAVGAALLATYVVLARLYWFRTPFIGMTAALASYLIALVWTHAAL